MRQDGVTLIVLEKDVSQYNLLKREFSATGISIYHATSAQDFITAVKPEREAVLICSYEDAGEHALSLFNECKKNNPDAPFIFIAQSISVKAAVCFMKAGVSHILLREDLTDSLTLILSLLAQKNQCAEHDPGDFKTDFNNRRYNSITQHSKQAFFLSQSDGKILEVNEGACRMFGYTAEEMLQLRVQDIIDYTGHQIQHKKPVFNGCTTGEFFGIRKSNERFSVEYSSVLFKGNGELQYISTVITDITERNRNTSQISLLMNNTAEAFVLIDKDLCISTFNLQFQRLYLKFFGISVTEGRSILDYAQPERKEIVRDVYQRVLKGADDFTEITIAVPDGEPKCFALRYSPAKDLHQVIIGAFVTITDVTEKKKTEEKLAASEKRFKALVENSADAVVVFTKEGKPLYISPSIERILGYTEEEASKLDLFSVVHPDDAGTIQKIWEELLQNPGVTFKGYTSRFLHKDGSWHWLEKTATNLLHDPDINGIVDNFRDITDKVNVEAQREYDRINQNALINSTHDLIWSVSSDYKLIAANRSFINNMEKITGLILKPGDCIIIDHLFPADFLCFWKNLYKRGLKGESFIEDVYIPQMGNAGASWIEIGVNPIFEGDYITGVACYSRDVTALKDHQNKLVEINRKLQTAQQISKLGYWEMNFVTKELFWSDEVYHIWEVTPDTFQVSRNSFYNSIHPDDLHLFNQIQEQAANGHTKLDVEYRILLPGGGIKYIFQKIEVIENEAGIPVKCEGIVQDITDRKLAEINVQTSNERFNLVSKATNDAIWDWNLQTNQVVRTGTGLETLFGYNTEEASADNFFWQKHVHPDDVGPLVIKRNQMIAADSVYSWEDEYRFLKSNGEYAVVYDKGFIIRDDKGKAVRVIGATQDITRLKESEVMLKKLNEKLEKRAQELQISNLELEQFAYVASHDLQEPLRMVSSFVQLLEKKYKGKLDATADQYIHFAIDGANRMKKLINDLLEYSRAGTNRDTVSPTDMNEVVKDVCTVFSTRIEEQGAEMHIQALPSLVYARKSQMMQLFQNLIGNALKFHGNEKPVITINAGETDTHWEFSVQDNGIGFDQKYADKIFVIFQRLQTAHQYTGTGIGLSICKKIVDRHHGQIWAQSEPGKGSTFYFSIKK